MHHSKRSFQLLTLQHAVKHKSISTSSRPQSCSNKTRLKRFGVCCRTCTCEDYKRHSKLPCQNGKNHLHHLHIKFSPKTSFQQTLFVQKHPQPFCTRRKLCAESSMPIPVDSKSLNNRCCSPLHRSVLVRFICVSAAVEEDKQFIPIQLLVYCDPIPSSDPTECKDSLH